MELEMMTKADRTAFLRRFKRSEKIYVSLEEALCLKFKQAAKLQQISCSELMRDLIIKHLQSR
jgi:hypothetical protein